MSSFSVAIAFIEQNQQLRNISPKYLDNTAFDRLYKNLILFNLHNAFPVYPCYIYIARVLVHFWLCHNRQLYSQNTTYCIGLCFLRIVSPLDQLFFGGRQTQGGGSIMGAGEFPLTIFFDI